MKRILNIIGIFFLSIIVFTGCQNFREDEMEMSPQTRAQLSSGTHYYWYKGNKIPITINTTTLVSGEKFSDNVLIIKHQ